MDKMVSLLRLTKWTLIIFVLLVAVLIPALIYTCQPHFGSPWARMALEDLSTTKQLILHNSPQVQHADSMYASWLENGYEKAKTMAGRVNSFPGYISVMRYYLSGFRDFHAEVVPLLKIINPSDKWPGFIVGERNDKVVITYRSNDAIQWGNVPPLGAQLLSCDHRSVAQLIKNNIIPFNRLNPAYPTTWHEYVPLLLVWDQNPFIQKLNKCTFSFKGQKKQYGLRWEVVEKPSPLSLGEKDFQEKLAEAAFGETPLFSIASFRQNAVWVSIPIFAWGLPTQGTTTTQLLDQVAKQVSKFRNKQLLVFDLRGNTGGDPKSMMPIIINLYGADYLRSLGDHFEWNMPQKIEFMATQRNLNHMIASQSPLAMINGLRSAIEQHQKLFVYRYTVLPPGNITNLNPVKAKVVLVTDGHCGSECDSFVMTMKSIPGVVQVGQATAAVATSTWNDVYVFSDNAAAIVYPTGLIVSSKIRDGEPIFPQYSYEGYMGDTQRLQAWVWKLYREKKLAIN